LAVRLEQTGVVEEIKIDAVTGVYEEAARARKTAARAMLVAALALFVALIGLIVLLLR
jgi:hypothetical protein